MGNWVLGSEDSECRTLAEYLEYLKNKGDVLVYSHTAQETYTTSWKQKTRNRLLGVKPGLPDYIIVTKHHVLFIEMKRQKGGVVSQAQKDWLKAITGAGGNSVVCKGFDEAKAYLDTVLKK